MSIYDTIPDEYITVGETATALKITEQEVIEKLRKGELQGVYNPHWNRQAPCWYVKTRLSYGYSQ